MSRPKILAIEDSPDDMEMLRVALDREGEEYELDVLQDGGEALRFIHDHRIGVRAPEPCVILLDLYLPKHDGMEVLKALRREPALTHIQVVVWSSFANLEQTAEAEKFGAFYRNKPTTLTEFFDLAAEILEICKGAILV